MNMSGNYPFLKFITDSFVIPLEKMEAYLLYDRLARMQLTVGDRWVDVP